MDFSFGKNLKGSNSNKQKLVLLRTTFFSFLHFFTQASLVECFYGFSFRKEPKRFKLQQAKVGSASHNLFFIPAFKHGSVFSWIFPSERT
jgi:hypothetical protein